MKNFSYTSIFRLYIVTLIFFSNISMITLTHNNPPFLNEPDKSFLKIHHKRSINHFYYCMKDLSPAQRKAFYRYLLQKIFDLLDHVKTTYKNQNFDFEAEKTLDFLREKSIFFRMCFSQEAQQIEKELNIPTFF